MDEPEKYPTMQRSLRNYLNNPTTRRLAWIRETFLSGTPAPVIPGYGLRLMPSSEREPRPGTLLIAPPMMHDPNFRRTVVLVCEHGDQGSFGLILNRPLAVPLHEVIRGVGKHKTSVSMGGPVQPDTLHFIHRHGDLIAKTIPLFNDVFWGGDFDLLKVLIETGRTSPRDLRFFLGYSGWSAGQLLDEIEAGGWILAQADVAALFPDNPAQLWGSSLRRLGGEYALLANFPEDPRMN